MYLFRHGPWPMAALLAFAWPATAATLHLQVTGDGAPLAGAVVSLHSPQAAAAVRGTSAAMDQRQSQFAPHVLAVTVGSTVAFPNSDNVRHQVYSFSDAKQFDLPLYGGRPAQPVLFDRAGVVELGCNIHDWMIGYVVVLDTPHFAISDDSGNVAIDAPPGEYRLVAWHEHQAAVMTGTPLELPAEGAQRPLDIDVTLPPTAPPPPGGNATSD